MCAFTFFSMICNLISILATQFLTYVLIFALFKCDRRSYYRLKVCGKNEYKLSKIFLTYG